MNLTGKMEGYRTTNQALVFSYEEEYQLMPKSPVSLLLGTDFDYEDILRANLEGRLFGEWSFSLGLSYLFL